MSKTFKHQAKYDRKVYWRNYPASLVPTYEDGEFTGWKRNPPEKPLKEPHPWYGMNVDLRRKTFWYKDSNRKCRKRVKRLIQQGKYVEAEVLKPENVDWHIW